MTAIRFGLRLGRWGIVGFSLAAFFLTLIQSVGFFQIAGHTAAERAAFGATIAALQAQFVALFAPAILPETVAGYVWFRGYNPLSILFAVWALASATGFARGDEERGVVDASLAAGISRMWLVASRTIAFAAGVVVATLAASIGFWLGVTSGNESIAMGGVVEAAALLGALTLACYALSLLVAQLVSPRVAVASAGAVLLALFLLNSFSRTFSELSTLRWLSPFRYWDLSQPLPRGGYFSYGGLAVLVGIAVAGSIASAVAFQRRDVGGALVTLPARPHTPSPEPSTAPWWRTPVIRGLFERRVGILAWAAGMGAIAVIFVALTRTIVQALQGIRALLPYLGIFGHRQLIPAVLGYTWFDVAQLLFAALAISYVARWAAEDTDGRLEMFLSSPISRAGVVLERMAVLTAAAVFVSAVSGVVLFYAARQQGIALEVSSLVPASLMLVPFALVFAGAGSLLASWNPRAAVALLGAFAFASYLDNQLGPIFKLPVWLQDLSVFKLFGTPLLTGLDARNVTLMLLLALAGLGSSILLMQRRDVGA